MHIDHINNLISTVSIDGSLAISKLNSYESQGCGEKLREVLIIKIINKFIKIYK